MGKIKKGKLHQKRDKKSVKRVSFRVINYENGQLHFLNQTFIEIDKGFRMQNLKCICKDQL